MQNAKLINKDLIVIDRLKINQEFSVNSNEDKTFVILLTGENDQEGDIKINIKGKKAYVKILGAIIGSGKQKIHLRTLQDHFQPESVSDLLIKAVLFDSSRFNYEGLIRIEKDAQKSNAYQKNQNILMSPQSWADSKPYLEIKANDVRCTHGATVGKLNNDELFYLESRGLSVKEATKLLLEGFFNDVWMRLEDKKIKNKLAQTINNKLTNLLH